MNTSQLYNLTAENLPEWYAREFKRFHDVVRIDFAEGLRLRLRDLKMSSPRIGEFVVDEVGLGLLHNIEGEAMPYLDQADEEFRKNCLKLFSNDRLEFVQAVRDFLQLASVAYGFRLLKPYSIEG